jgi:hypothetical protein
LLNTKLLYLSISICKGKCDSLGWNGPGKKIIRKMGLLAFERPVLKLGDISKL